MPSIVPDGSRSQTAARVVPADDGPGVVGGDADGIGRMTAALLTGDAEVRTSDPAVARRVCAVVDRLLAARSSL